MQTHSIRILLIVGTLIAALGPRTARAQGLEIETNLVQNMTSLGFATMTSGGGARIGLPLGRRTVLLTGLDFSASGQAGGYVKSESYSVHVPLELKVYLVQPAAGKLVPSLRAGLGYSLYTSFDGEYADQHTYHRLEGLAGAGLNYFFTPGVALGTGVNVIYGRSAPNSSYGPAYNQEYWSLDLNWQLGVLFRV